jgi:hypothetical protein
MDTVHRHIRDSRERLPALALAIAATVLVFAAINAGFTPHAATHAWVTPALPL